MTTTQARRSTTRRLTAPFRAFWHAQAEMAEAGGGYFPF